MRTQRHRSMVSTTSVLLLVAALGLGACAGRQHPFAETTATRTVPLQFDNQATVFVDVYLVAGALEWRLGRVPPAMRATLRVPESAIDQTFGLAQLAVIPGSQRSAQASRDPRATIANSMTISQVLSQQWIFRQPSGAPLQLQAIQLPGRP